MGEPSSQGGQLLYGSCRYCFTLQHIFIFTFMLWHSTFIKRAYLFYAHTLLLLVHGAICYLLITWTLQVVTCVPSSCPPITCRWQPLPAPPPAALLSSKPAHHSWPPLFSSLSYHTNAEGGKVSENLLLAKTHFNKNKMWHTFCSPRSPHTQDVSHSSNTPLLLHHQCKWIQHWKGGWADGKDKKCRFPNHRQRVEQKMGRAGEEIFPAMARVANAVQCHYTTLLLLGNM